jgi:hypothetical protein
MRADENTWCVRCFFILACLVILQEMAVKQSAPKEKGMKRNALIWLTYSSGRILILLFMLLLIFTGSGCTGSVPATVPLKSTPTSFPKTTPISRPADHITEFALPSRWNFPASLIVGPDQALWFTENVGRIGRITTTGAITEFPLPVSHSLVDNLISKPDGTLWFTETSPDLTNRIGRITTTGTMTIGPDGALWFTETKSNQIGRITNGGNITEFTIPRDNTLPVSITVGPDGALWFTEKEGDYIGRFSLT